MLGLRPTTTGIYGLAPWFRTLPEWKDRVTLPQHFQRARLPDAHARARSITAAVGGPRQKQKTEFDVWGPAGGIGVKPEKKLIAAYADGQQPADGLGRLSAPRRRQGRLPGRELGRRADQERAEGQAVLSRRRFLPAARARATRRRSGSTCIPTTTACCRSSRKTTATTRRASPGTCTGTCPSRGLKWVQENDQWRNLVAVVSGLHELRGRAGRPDPRRRSKRPGWRRTRSSCSGAITAGISARRGSPARTRSGTLARACR